MDDNFNEKSNELKQFDMLVALFDTNENDMCVLDGNGVYLMISDSYERHNGVKREELIGNNVAEFVKKGVFYPSVTLKTMETKKKETLVQTNWLGRKIMATGTPIFDDEGNIKYVVCYNTIDVSSDLLSDTSGTVEKINIVKELMRQYDISVNQLKDWNDENEKEYVFCSRHMKQIYALVERVADTTANVLITGETGTGKSLIAKLLHEMGSRSQNSFVEVDCGSIPDTLIESELFGYEEGAFTGANRGGKIGRVEAANGGTLFLDEIGEMPLDMQVKLLRMIQDKKIYRVGGIKPIEMDFRIIAATNKNLETEAEIGRFREDLYYRLNVIPIHVPPLRKRRDEIPQLVNNFIRKFNAVYSKEVSMSNTAIRLLETYDWPGNIRQLENTVERLVILCQDNVVDANEVDAVMNPSGFYDISDSKAPGTLKEYLEIHEASLFQAMYRECRTSVEIAKQLGISQTTASRRLRKYVTEYTK